MYQSEAVQPWKTMLAIIVTSCFDSLDITNRKILLGKSRWARRWRRDHSCDEVIGAVWTKVSTLIKREVLIDGERFYFADNETPGWDEIGNFVILQDKTAKKNYSISQLNSDVFRKLRDKHVNVMTHMYGNQNLFTKRCQRLSCSPQIETGLGLTVRRHCRN